MTAATLAPAPTPAFVPLTERLAELRRQRDEALLEARPTGRGDDADRATNVDAHIRLAVLERRIADVELALADQHEVDGAEPTVAPGRSVTLDFGDGPELYFVGSAEQAGPDLQVVTPDSAVGRALLGAGPGFRTTYATRAGRTQEVRVVSVA
jgi:transcription elongation factor GreA